ncbi:MAG TPA: DUF2934 domain-containing protein [Povalibacter sp.]|nr:DUF2934 domain-containing protein [Povalibacter sp.]
MPSRSRQTRSSDTSATRPAVSTTPSQIPSEEPVNEIRLLGSLYPAVNREERIAISAYWRAAQRQFAPGHELDDWLAAEREVDEEESQRAAR